MSCDANCMQRQIELDGTESNIEILSELRAQFNCFDKQEEPVYRALSDAIRALSAQPTQSNDSNTLNALDCISRQAAIDVVDGGAELIRRVLDNMDVVCGERSKFAWGLGLLESCINDLNELPSAQPERKKGKWIEQDDGWDWVYYECSVCKEPFTLIDGTPQDNLYNFCPNCGSDMRGENNVDNN